MKFKGKAGGSLPYETVMWFSYRPIISRNVDLIVLLTEFLFGVVFVLIGYAGEPFPDFVLGGVIAVPFGISAGLLYERHKNILREDTITGAKYVVIIYIIIILIMSYPVYTTIIRGRRNVEILRNISAHRINTISFYSGPYGHVENNSQLLLTIRDQDVLKDFSNRSRDVSAYQCGGLPDNVQYTTWIVEIAIDDAPSMWLLWTHRSDHPDAVTGQFIGDNYNPLSIMNYGHLYSEGLRKWFEENKISEVMKSVGAKSPEQR